MAQVSHAIAKWLKLVVSLPFSELLAADFKLCLPDGFAKLFG
jgi:hypothetical protein